MAAWSALYLLIVVGAALAQPDAARGYIGPGAGIALVGSLLAVLGALVSAFFALLTWPIRWVWRAIRGQKAYRRARFKRVIVLGLDGLEPSITEKMLADGELPNLARLREQGGYFRLGTTWPPLSPVAWSSFSTGTNPGKHNIFDFIARNPNDYRPTISSVRIRESKRALRLGRLVIPLGRPELAQLRRSKPFWTVLGEHGIFSAVIRVPITFPPDKFRGVQLSAMCVPDLRGTQGMFSLFAEGGESGATMDGDVGGDRIPVARAGDAVRGYVRGPVNSLRSDRPELRAPFEVRRAASGAVTLHVCGQQVALHPGRYTNWVRVSFSAAPGIKVHGVARFYLKRFDAPFEMYCTPLQIDPDKPVMPIAHPTVYSCYLARLLGPFSTLGLAEDTWSLSEGVLSEDAFLEQAYGIHAERERMFFDALDRVKQGLVTCVFDGPDRIQHMFWRFIDERHPALPNERRGSHAHVIPEMYRRMDDLVGRTMSRVGNDTALIAMSDHGFKAFRRGVDLNAWLLEHGYLALKGAARTTTTPYLADIDWARTRAYAIGLAGIFVNQAGREAQGIVAKGEETQKLVTELGERLTGLRDDATGEVAIQEAVAKRAVYHGPYLDNAPDVIIGYAVGYRVSWDAAVGKCGASVFSDNVKAWSGDHCIHPALVPGVLFSNVKLDPKNAEIIDLAPTILDMFGVARPEYMDGESLLPPTGAGAVAPPAARPGGSMVESRPEAAVARSE